MPDTPVFRAGDLACYDGLHALIPCKVTRVYRDGAGAVRLDLVITASRSSYPRGYVRKEVAPHYVWPRALVRYRKYSTVLAGPYAWLPEDE